MNANNLILQNVSLDDLRQLIKEEVQTVASTPKEAENELKTVEQSEYLTRKETAKYLKVSLTTLWNLTKNGKLKTYTVGGSIRYRTTEVSKAIKGGGL